MIYYAKFYGVNCYFDYNNNRLEGCGVISDFLLTFLAIPFSQFIEFTCQLIDPWHVPEFPIKVGKPVEKKK